MTLEKNILNTVETTQGAEAPKGNTVYERPAVTTEDQEKSSQKRLQLALDTFKSAKENPDMNPDDMTSAKEILRTIEISAVLQLSRADVQTLFFPQQSDGSYVFDTHSNGNVERYIGAGMAFAVPYMSIQDKSGTMHVGKYSKSGRIGFRHTATGGAVDYLDVWDGYKLQTPTQEQIDAFEAEESNTSIDTMDPSDENAYNSLMGIYRSEVADDQIKVAQLEKIKTYQFEDYVRNYPGMDLQDFVMDTTPATADDLKNEFANIPNRNSALTFDSAQRFMNAIASQESNHDYTAMGTPISSPANKYYNQKALGMYQFMPDNWIKWAGVDVPPTAKNQDIVAFRQNINNLNRWLNAGNSMEHSVQLAAVNWYGNNSQKLRNVSDISKKGDSTLGYSPYRYSQSILGKIQA